MRPLQVWMIFTLLISPSGILAASRNQMTDAPPPKPTKEIIQGLGRVSHLAQQGVKQGNLDAAFQEATGLILGARKVHQDSPTPGNAAGVALAYKARALVWK